MTPQPQQNIIDKMMQEYDCIFYPMCVKARELLYCPKKVGKSDCEDYRSRPAPSPETPQEIRGFVMLDRQKDFVLWVTAR